MQVPDGLRRSRRTLPALAVTAAALAISAGAGATSASAATTTAAAATPAANSTTPTAVQPGIKPSQVPGAKVFGDTPASTQEAVSFVLKEQNEGQLAAAVESGMTHFLSVSQFAAEYGQSRQYIQQLTSYLSSFGIKTSVDADDIDVTTTGTAGQYDKALDTTQKNYRAPAVPAHDGFAGHAAQSFHGVTSAQLPKSLASGITAVLGLTNYSAFASGSQHTTTSLAKPRGNGSSPDSTSGCEALTGLPNACHLPQDFASQYGLSGLYNKGAQGQGQTIAIVTLAAVDPGGPQYYWKNIEGLPSSGRKLTVDNVDGGPGAPSDAAGAGETDLDIEQSGGLAPKSNVIDYQAPNDDAGFVDAYFEAASQNIAATLSSSWAESETFLASGIASGTETAGYEPAFDEAFLELAAQGQSAFTAAGDWGAYTASIDLDTTNLSVAASADSPYITAAGGTTLPWSATLTSTDGSTSVNVSVPKQRIWGWDYLWAPVATLDDESFADSATSQIGGTGGGFSTIESQPSYQRGVSGTSSFSATPYLTPTDFEEVGGLTEPTSWSVNPNPGVISGQGSGRAVPDVSTDADPYTGYLLYEPSFAGVNQATLQGGWGGTSFVAPQLNGSAAVIDSYLGHRVGFWNPALYRSAQSRNSPLTPLNDRGTSNDNLYYSGTPGTLYNEGAGLGTPDLAKLAGDF